MPSMETLVTDRTRANVSRVLNLMQQIANQTATQDEIDEFLANRYEAIAVSDGVVAVSDGVIGVLTTTDTWKGAYNYTDLNRVGQWVAYLTERLAGIGLFPVTVAKDDWTEADYVDAASLAYYLDDLAKIRSALAVPSTTPALPESMDALNSTKAHTIETLLGVVNTLIDNTKQAFVYSGEPYAGEVY